VQGAQGRRSNKVHLSSRIRNKKGGGRFITSIEAWREWGVEGQTVLEERGTKEDRDSLSTTNAPTCPMPKEVGAEEGCHLNSRKERTGHEGEGAAKKKSARQKSPHREREVQP